MGNQEETNVRRQWVQDLGSLRILVSATVFTESRQQGVSLLCSS
jgi:hypothetical protein